MNRDKLMDLLEKHEGKRNKPYTDTKGILTIGIGWNMQNRLPNHIAGFLHVNGYITDEMVYWLLGISIDNAEINCQELFPEFESFTENRQLALCDLMFNMGQKKIGSKFPLFVHNVNIQDWQAAADELKYANGETKTKLSDYWVQLHGDPDGTDDGKQERPETIYGMLVDG
jgi:GH24 family phage-related lysozyme (muramidase)